MTENTKCAKCGGRQTEGFVFDRGDHQIKQTQTWVEGKPESSFWSGLKTSGRAAYTVTSRRCDDCGYLEFYTAEKTDPGYFS